MKILYIYKWCTFGGVEKVLINRALAFKKYNLPISQRIYFLHAGVSERFKAFIEKFNLRDFLDIVEEIQPSSYNHIVSIDTPEAFDLIPKQKLILEYHTAYKEHGSYIKNIDASRIKRVIVPSAYFKERVSKIRSDLYDKTSILRNFVIKGISEDVDFHLPEWSLTPILHLGRTDSLKNPHFVAKALKSFISNSQDKVFFCVVGSSIDEKRFIKYVDKIGLKSRCVFYPNLSFERVEKLLDAISNKKGIFVSASKGESFGLSAAEAIFYSIPVLLSNIQAHKNLVMNNEKYIFEENVGDFSSKLDYVLKNYAACKNDMVFLKENLKSAGFIEDWELLQKGID